MEFRLLGPLDVVEGGRSLALGGAKQRATLALLLLRRNELVPTAAIVDGLWPDAPPPAAVNTVQQYVSRLRKQLGSNRIVTTPAGYMLRVAPGEVDLDRCEALVQSGRDSGLRKALALWRGSPLADIDEPFAHPEMRRLEELRLCEGRSRRRDRQPSCPSCPPVA
jgi:DNA-binding SARP family transcriptional activator